MKCCIMQSFGISISFVFHNTICKLSYFCISIFCKSTSYCVNLHLSSVPIYDRCHWGHCKKLWYLNSTTHQTFIYSLSPPLYGSLSHEISTSISCIWNKCPFMHFWQWPVTYTLKTAFMIYITKEKSFFVCLIVKTNHEIPNLSKKSLHISYVIIWTPIFATWVLIFLYFLWNKIQIVNYVH